MNLLNLLTRVTLVVSLHVSTHVHGMHAQSSYLFSPQAQPSTAWTNSQRTRSESDPLSTLNQKKYNRPDGIMVDECGQHGRMLYQIFSVKNGTFDLMVMYNSTGSTSAQVFTCCNSQESIPVRQVLPIQNLLPLLSKTRESLDEELVSLIQKTLMKSLVKKFLDRRRKKDLSAKPVRSFHDEFFCMDPEDETGGHGE